MANPVIRLKRGTGNDPSLQEGELAVNTQSKHLYVGLSGGTKFVLKPQTTVIVVNETPTIVNILPPETQYVGTIKPYETFTADRNFLLPNSGGTFITTGNLGDISVIYGGTF